MGKPHKERKAEIIQGALTLAAELGVKKVTTQAIADHVGIAQATVFRHFKTRDEIFSGAIGWLATSMFEALSGCFSSSEPADVKLRLLVVRHLSFISQHKGLPRLLFSDRLHLESPDLKSTVQAVMNRYTGKVAELVQEGLDAGCFRTDLDAQKTAQYIAALLQGLIMRWSIFDFQFSLEEEADVATAFIDSMLAKRDAVR